MPRLTVQRALAVIRATGCTATYNSADREFRVTPPGRKAPAQTYYTDDARDAVETAIAMTSTRDFFSIAPAS